MKNFKEINLLAKNSFESLSNADTSVLRGAISLKDSIAKQNMLLSEMFWSDFSVEWNKIQSVSFINTGVILDVGSSIKKSPYIWLSEWYKEIDKIEINNNFDIRKFSFEKYKYEVDKLTYIFSLIFKKTEKDLSVCDSIKDNLIKGAYLYEDTIESNKKYLIRSIYESAVFESFQKVLVKNQRMQKDACEYIVEYFYGKNKENNKNTLFANYINRNDKNTDKEKNIMLMKEKQLSLRDEDIKYWKYYLSIIPNDLWVECLMDNFDINPDFGEKKDKTKSLAFKMFAKNNYEILSSEIEEKNKSVFVKKKFKI